MTSAIYCFKEGTNIPFFLICHLIIYRRSAPSSLNIIVICCEDKNCFSYYHCLVSTISAKNAETIHGRVRCPQKMQRPSTGVYDVRKKCVNHPRVWTIAAKKMRKPSTGVDDIRKKCWASCKCIFLSFQKK